MDATYSQHLDYYRAVICNGDWLQLESIRMGYSLTTERRRALIERGKELGYAYDPAVNRFYKPKNQLV